MAKEQTKETKKKVKEKEKDIIKLTSKEKNKIKDEIKKEVQVDIETKVEEKVVDEVVSKIKEESVNEIKEDFVNDVKEDVKKQIVKEEKKLLRHRKWKIIRRDLLILILLAIIGYLCYLLYKGIDIDISTKKNFENSKIVTKTTKVVKDNNWYIEHYGYLLDETHLKLPGENINKYYLYNRSQKAEDINISIKLTMAYNLLENGTIKTSGNKYVIENSDLKQAYNKLFDGGYVETAFNIDCMTYNFVNGKYEAIINSCSNLNNYEVREEITKIYEEKNNLVIETIMGVVSDNKLYNYNNLYNPIAESFNGNSLRDYRGNLNCYKYMFAKIDGHNKLVSIEKE